MSDEAPKNDQKTTKAHEEGEGFYKAIPTLARISRRKSFRWFMVAYILVVVVMIASTTVLRPTLLELGIVSLNEQEKTDAALLAFDDRLNNLITRFDEYLRTLDQAQISDIELRIQDLDAALANIEIKNAAQIFRRVDIVERNIVSFRNDVEELQLALNPTQPVEVLTLARLGDQVILFQDQLDELAIEIQGSRLSLANQIDRESLRTRAEIDRILGVIKWVGLLLIPITLNFFRDIFSSGSPSQTSE